MTDVRLRHETTGKATSLGSVDFFSVDRVIPKLAEWGVKVSTFACEDFIDTDRLCAQFRYDTELGEAYFEVLISDD